jgi:hypothetical protein
MHKIDGPALVKRFRRSQSRRVTCG